MLCMGRVRRWRRLLLPLLVVLLLVLLSRRRRLPRRLRSAAVSSDTSADLQQGLVWVVDAINFPLETLVSRALHRDAPFRPPDKQPIVDVAQRIRHVRLALIVPPGAVHNELVLMVPV